MPRNPLRPVEVLHIGCIMYRHPALGAVLGVKPSPATNTLSWLRPALPATHLHASFSWHVSELYMGHGKDTRYTVDYSHCHTYHVECIDLHAEQQTCL